MQTTIAVEDIKLTLAELLDRLTPGDEVILTRNQQPVAKLVSERPSSSPGLRPPPGLGKGFITVVAGRRRTPEGLRAIYGLRLNRSTRWRERIEESPDGAGSYRCRIPASSCRRRLRPPI